MTDRIDHYDERGNRIGHSERVSNPPRRRSGGPSAGLVVAVTFVVIFVPLSWWADAAPPGSRGDRYVIIGCMFFAFVALIAVWSVVVAFRRGRFRR